MAWKEPKTDWAVNPKNPMAEDFNRIEGNIQALKNDIEIKKGDIVNALQSIGMDVSITDTYEDIANKIKAADQGAKVITPGTSNITIPKGFHNGSGYVKGDSSLRSYNIKQGIRIFDVLGVYNPLAFESGSVTGCNPTIHLSFKPYACYAENDTSDKCLIAIFDNTTKKISYDGGYNREVYIYMYDSSVEFKLSGGGETTFEYNILGIKQ